MATTSEADLAAAKALQDEVTWPGFCNHQTELHVISQGQIESIVSAEDALAAFPIVEISEDDTFKLEKHLNPT